MVSLFGATTQVTTGLTSRAPMIDWANSGKSSPMAMPTMASTVGCATIACAQVPKCSRLVCPVTSTGLPSAANGGTIGRSDCNCSSSGGTAMPRSSQ